MCAKNEFKSIMNFFKNLKSKLLKGAPLSTGLTSGYKPPLPPSTVPSTPLEFFKLFFTDELIDCIVTETNRYAKESINLK